MRTHATTSLVALAASALLLGGCAGRDDAPSSDADSTSESTATAQPRLVVASDDGVEVLDASTLESLDTFDLASRPKLLTAGDDRHVFALQYDSKKVGVVDAGSWSEAHGDHSHSYVADPDLLSTTFDHGTSYHAVSDDERSVVWFDDDGSFVAFDWKGLEDDDVDPQRFETGTPHHGVAVPLSDGGFLASVAEGDHATGVAVLDADGTRTKRIETCPGLHGEAHVGDDAYAFGCEGGVLVVADGEGTTIAAPVEGTGTGTLLGDHDSDLLVGDLYAAEGDAGSTQLALYDVEAAEADAVDLGVAFSGFGRAHGSTVALGTDGALHVLDEETGTVRDTFDVVDPFELSDDWTVPKPQVTVGGDVAYVTDPRDRSVVAIDVGSGKVRARGTLGSVPTSLVAVNAPHRH